VPRPSEPGQRYVPGLDGVRALAVISVIIYHLGVPGAQGGMLGVGVFFTLSGYLITDILLTTWRRHGTLALGHFWARRARRLLPAVFVMLAVVSVWVALFDANQLTEVRRQVLAAAVYLSNWSTIAYNGSYFARFAAPLPLDHLWSLAIEEQFYLVWPWVLPIGIWTARTRVRLALMTLGLAAVSIILMTSLYHPGYDPTRVYEGTDTRAFALLIGAALAMVWPLRPPRIARPPGVRNLLDAAGVVGLIVIGLLVWRTNPYSHFLYPWGFILLSLATAAVIAAVVNPSSTLGAALGWRPLRWTGVRSYGIYLWQWPVIVLAAPGATGFHLPRAALEVAVTVIIASVSWRYIEDPIRHGALGRIWHQLRSGAGALDVRRRTLALSSGVVAVLFVPVVSLAGVLPTASANHGPTYAAGPLLKETHAITTTSTSASSSGKTTRTGATSTVSKHVVATKTSCKSVVYIGDSTSEGETSSDYIPNPRKQLPAQLADVGVTTTYPEISGARSIVETYEGNPNAAQVAQSHVSDGFDGCWIIAMGTNDSADVAAGSNVGLKDRIKQMMSIIGHQPVLWVDAVTLLQSSPYAESGMQQWNQDLLDACTRYPNMRVYDWSAVAKPKWFIPDGIHYYSSGYVARSHDIAHGLLHAFPAAQPPSASCVVH
jgi:peptidoglycan/LPS O-acetylase OafA/YrhL